MLQVVLAILVITGKMMKDREDKKKPEIQQVFQSPGLSGSSRIKPKPKKWW